MSTPASLQTTQLHRWVLRIRSGDHEARNELIRKVQGNLERLASLMLRRFPQVARFEQTEDVLNNALLRLMRSLETVQPGSVKDFFNLAAVHIRWELLDMAKHYRKVLEMETSTRPLEPTEVCCAEEDLDRWSRLHQVVENLPAREREVFSLTFYHDRKQVEIAELLGVDERTVRRWWCSACQKLCESMDGKPP
jgi:RNA polymerase sigma factor (sigma-70 family)